MYTRSCRIHNTAGETLHVVQKSSSLSSSSSVCLLPPRVSAQSHGSSGFPSIAPAASQHQRGKEEVVVVVDSGQAEFLQTITCRKMFSACLVPDSLVGLQCDFNTEINVGIWLFNRSLIWDFAGQKAETSFQCVLGLTYLNLWKQMSVKLNWSPNLKSCPAHCFSRKVNTNKFQNIISVSLCSTVLYTRLFHNSLFI